MVHKLGYGNWDELKAAFRTSPLFRFDWFVKSRTTQELARRCDTLIRLVEKENQEYDERERQARKEKKLAKVRFGIFDMCCEYCFNNTNLQLNLIVNTITLCFCHTHLTRAFVYLDPIFYVIKQFFMYVILYWLGDLCFRAWHHQSVLWLGRMRVPFP